MRRSNISEDFNHLVTILTSKNFLNCQILCNEVPFFIADYDIAKDNEMKKMQAQLIKKLAEFDVKVLNVNIYDLSIDILKQNDDWDWCIENEQTISKDKLKEELQGILDVQDVITPAITKLMNETDYDIMFLTGIGEVFPYIRSHNILNNLQKFAKEKPTLMFFPGEYINYQNTGSTLNLFGKLQDDKYYRAANIYEIQEV